MVLRTALGFAFTTAFRAANVTSKTSLEPRPEKWVFTTSSDKQQAKSVLAKAQTTKDKRSRKPVLDMSLPWAGKF